MMSESEGRAWAFNPSRERIIALIEEHASSWTPNGSSAATAAYLVRQIRAMPVPRPSGDSQ
jgi:hypothetical protein